MKRIILLALISLIALSPNAYGEIELRTNDTNKTCIKNLRYLRHSCSYKKQI
mgnify:CR=1 FL=1